MGGIPIISDIWETILAFVGWVFQSMPSPFNWIFFIVMISLFLSFFSLVFDTLGIEHPRFGAPSECQAMSSELSNAYKKLMSGNITNMEQEDCEALTKCINDLAGEQNITCSGCWCIRDLASFKFNPTCGIEGLLLLPSIGLFDENSCAMKTYYSVKFAGNITLLDACLYNMYNATPLMPVYAKMSEKCRKMGIDILDTKVIWGSALIFSVLLIFFKFWAILK